MDSADIHDGALQGFTLPGAWVTGQVGGGLMFGASGAAASHLPNERPIALASKRPMPTAARFSPDGSMVSVGTCMGRIAVFDAASGNVDAQGSNNNSNVPPQQQQQQ